MKKRNLAMVMLMCTALAACGKQATQTPVETVENPVTGEEDIVNRSSGSATDLTAGIESIDAPTGEFSKEEISALSVASFRLFAETVLEEQEDRNVLISPISIALAFGMAGNGAEGDTLAQIEDVIGGGNSIDEMNVLLYDMQRRMDKSSEAHWRVANSIWFKDDGKFEILPGFESKAASWYDADLFNAPFDSGTVGDINKWVNVKTNGMISDIVQTMPDDVGMYLINALAFEAEWKEEYEDNDILEGRCFTNADGSRSQVTMLNSEENSYFTINGGMGFYRQYKGGDYSFMGLLPPENVSLEEYIAEMSNMDTDITSLNWNHGKAIVQIPEFSYDYDTQMSEILKQMGMDKPFDIGNTDFNSMARCLTTGEYYIWIDEVLHKTHIEVDRKGTRATAATAVLMLTSADSIPPKPVYIILDRPFIYGIIDNETRLPVFLGCVKYAGSGEYEGEYRTPGNRGYEIVIQ